MDEPSLHDLQFDVESPSRGIDWLAAVLELIPLSSILLFAVYVVGNSSDGFWFVWGPAFASGFGWWKIGRFGTGCILAVARAVALWGLVAAMIVLFVTLLSCEGFDGDPECDGTAAGVALLASLGLAAVIAFLVPIASAIMVARASRDRSDRSTDRIVR